MAYVLAFAGFAVGRLLGAVLVWGVLVVVGVEMTKSIQYKLYRQIMISELLLRIICRRP